MQQPFRIQPQGSVSDYKTYSIRQPKTAQTRIGTCQAAGCDAYEFGWKTIVPLNSPQADYIRNQSGRRFREAVEQGQSIFTFYPGQQCFTQHHVQDRPQFFGVRDGDFRGNPTGRKLLHRNGADWVEDFGTHQQRLRDQLEKG